MPATGTLISWKQNKAREPEAVIRSRAIAKTIETGYEDKPGGNAGRWTKGNILLYCRWSC